MRTRILVFTEYSTEDMDGIVKADAAHQAERAMHPEKYPRYAMTTLMVQSDLPRLTERIRSIDVYEADNPEQIMNVGNFWGAQMSEHKSLKRHYIMVQELSAESIAEYSHQRRLIAERKDQTKTTQ